jgi:hypothetical protein
MSTRQEKGKYFHPARSWAKVLDASELEQASAIFHALGDPAERH